MFQVAITSPSYISCGNLWNLWTNQLIGIPETIPHSLKALLLPHASSPTLFAIKKMALLTRCFYQAVLSIDKILKKWIASFAVDIPIIVNNCKVCMNKVSWFGALTCPNTSGAGEKCLIIWSHDDWYIISILTIFERRSCKNMFAQTTQTQHGKTIKTTWTSWNGTKLDDPRHLRSKPFKKAKEFSSKRLAFETTRRGSLLFGQVFFKRDSWKFW